MTTTIAVSGASGNLGSAIVKELAAKKSAGANIRIVGVSRSAASKPIAHADESRVGDANDRASLDKAYVGIDRIVIIISSDMAPGVPALQVMKAIDAAVAAHIKHIVILGSASSRYEPLVNANDYFTCEQHLFKTVPNFGWTVLRMLYFSETISGVFIDDESNNIIGYSDTARINFVSRDDLGAAAAAAVLTSDGHRGAIYNITGPQAITLVEMAAIVQKVTGKPSALQLTTSEKHRATLAGFNLPQLDINLLDELVSAQAAGNYDITTGDVERLTGRKPKTFETVFSASRK
jgi:NAD(P)H dehydrogenase (quinone)